MSNISANTGEEVHQENKLHQQPLNHPHGSSSDPNAEVIALSPTTLMATNRFVCEICNKGFQRNQNLQLHRRGRNPPWKLRQRGSNELMKKRVYVCPEPSCVHHNPARALGDSTGIKKITADNMAHQKTCGTREYKCDWGTIFSKYMSTFNTLYLSESCRRDSFITHRAFCDTLTEENNRQIELPDLIATTVPLSTSSNNTTVSEFNNNYDPKNPLQEHIVPLPFKSTSEKRGSTIFGGPKNMSHPSSTQLDNTTAFNHFQDCKTTLLPHQLTSQMGATASNNNNNNSIIINSPTMMQKNFVISGMAGPHHNHNSSSYDHFHHPNPDQSHMQFFHKGQQEMSLIFDSNNNDMRMFGLMKNVEQEIGTGNSSLVHDFLGVGGATSRVHEPQNQKQQQQRLELDTLTHQRLQIMNHFHHHLPHGDSATMEKSIWDI
ncbi:hypothetical protein AAZX31_10G020000 [Glycine max]